MRIRPSTVAVALAVTLVFSGLWLALRSLAAAEETTRAASARQIAIVAEAFLDVRVAELGALHAPFLGVRGAPDVRRFAFIAPELRATPFRRVWVTDARGRLLHGARLRPGMPAGDPDALAGGDTLATQREDRVVPTAAEAALLRRAARTGRAAVAVVVGTEPRPSRMITIADPVLVDDRVIGVVGGSVSVHDLGLVLGLADSTVFAHRGLALVARDPRLPPTAAPGDTVIARAAAEPGAFASGPTERYVETVRLPGGGRWTLALAYPAISAVQVELWFVAIAALAALGLGAWHERRQTARIADRSRELERLSEELLQANRAKSEFLANVSHELRTPLNAVVGFAELLRDGVYGELTPRQSGPVSRIEASATHLRGLVDQVLDLAKITAGRLEVQYEIVDLRQVALDIGTEMEPLFAERGLAFSIAVGAGVPRVRTDPAHLRQIVVNLLGNAVKFTDAGGVTVRTRHLPPLAPGTTAANASGSMQEAQLRRQSPDPARAWVVLQVIDTGRGIAPADHARIFDEFEQVNPGSRGDSDRRGTGLGLPISRRLARLLGGELTVDSAPSRGSTFTLWLPA